MMGPVRRRLAPAAFAAAVALNLAIVYAPSAPGGPALPHVDKLVHLIVFALVAWSGRLAGLDMRWLLPLLAAHAVASELVQHYLLPDRSGDPWDVLADCLGVAIGAVLPTSRASSPVRGNMSS
jgi:hypothetical protein